MASMPPVRSVATAGLFTSEKAAVLSGVTYRQLDHWTRRGWFVPAALVGEGRGSKRWWDAADVLKFAALKHFADSGWAVRTVGPLMAGLEMSGPYVVMGSASGLVCAASQSELHRHFTPQRLTVFDGQALSTKIRKHVRAVQVTGDNP